MTQVKVGSLLVWTIAERAARHCDAPEQGERLFDKQRANAMTDAVSYYLTDDHSRCDHLLGACESALAAKDWTAADEAFPALRDAILRHFSMEEEILFPEIEERSPVAAGPAGVMRMEHQQMRQLLMELELALAQRSRDICLGAVETFNMLAQQHNAKEEGILYPLADDVLSAGADALIARMKGV